MSVTNAYKASDGSLVLLDAQTKDEIVFTCVATNAYGPTRGVFRLDVLGILLIPRKITVQ